jgi:hypothetical protein
MSEPLTSEEIAELRRLVAEARPQPWHRGDIYGQADFRMIVYGPDGTQVCSVYQHAPDYPASADLIVAAVAALPRLLDLAESRSSPAALTPETEKERT